MLDQHLFLWRWVAQRNCCRIKPKCYSDHCVSNTHVIYYCCYNWFILPWSCTPPLPHLVSWESLPNRPSTSGSLSQKPNWYVAATANAQHSSSYAFLECLFEVADEISRAIAFKLNGLIDSRTWVDQSPLRWYWPLQHWKQNKWFSIWVTNLLKIDHWFLWLWSCNFKWESPPG